MFNKKYLTYDEFLSLGGMIDELNFNYYELSARKKLDYITQNRIVEVDDNIKFCMVKIINYYYNKACGAYNIDDIQSFKNDEVSINYKNISSNAKTSEEKLMDEIIAILPVQLVSRCIRLDTSNI